MLIFQIKRIISSEKWFNYVVPLFFLEMPKIWVDRTMLNREKKEDGLTCRLPQILRPSLRAFFFFFLMKAQPIATLIAAAITKATGKLR